MRAIAEIQHDISTIREMPGDDRLSPTLREIIAELAEHVAELEAREKRKEQ